MLKYCLITLIICFQILGFVFLLIKFKVSLYFFGSAFVILIMLLVMLIFERLKEKKEEDQDDLSNY